MPDDVLLADAEKGTLSDPGVLDRHIRRLLADPRAKSLVTNFSFQWLKMRGLDDIDPDAVVFPNFDDGLREAFRREMELFVESILREDRSVLDLMTADHTFVNDRSHSTASEHPRRAVRRVGLRLESLGLLGKGGLMTTPTPSQRASAPWA